MKLRSVLVGLAVLIPVMLGGGSAGAGEKSEKAAAAAALAWLELIDQGRFGQSWDEAAEIFKGALSREEWTLRLKGVRLPLGQKVGRVFVSAEYTKTLPGAPDGEYVVIQYQTEFRNKKKAVETVTPMLDPDGIWRVAGYFIK